MSMIKCRVCGLKMGSKRKARKHFQENHSGEIETPKEELPDTESEQRDFSGEKPTTEGHTPEYLIEDQSEANNTRSSTLWEFERDTDGSIAEYQGDSE